MAKASALVLARRARFGLADIALAVLVVSVVAMMIVPLPTWLLDILISTNLSLSVAILLVVLYVPDALAIATFPTVLLLTTLFRLALNVSRRAWSCSRRTPVRSSARSAPSWSGGTTSSAAWSF